MLCACVRACVHACVRARVWVQMFLDHKYLYYDVDPFLFYIICEHDDQVTASLSALPPTQNK